MGDRKWFLHLLQSLPFSKVMRRLKERLELKVRGGIAFQSITREKKRKKEEEILSHRILKPAVSIWNILKIRNVFLGAPLHFCLQPILILCSICITVLAYAMIKKFMNNH